MNKDRQLKYFSKYMFNRTYLFPKSIVINYAKSIVINYGCKFCHYQQFNDLVLFAATIVPTNICKQHCNRVWLEPC